MIELLTDIAFILVLGALGVYIAYLIFGPFIEGDDHER